MQPNTRWRIHVAWCAMLLGLAGDVGAQNGDARRLVASGVAAEGARATKSAFALDQLQYGRVREARRNAGPRIARLFEAKGIPYRPEQIYLRAFKRSRILELWVKPVGESRFRLLKTYAICALAGKPGPKRRQGDEQVPEGFYVIDLFNPTSSYHLSLRIDYPNRRDRIVNRGGRMGGDIFIHGDCRSAGCLAVTDAGIEEIYWLAVEARSMGQRAIPVHIFPARPDTEAMHRLMAYYSDRPAVQEFWRSLEPGYQYFERNRRVPRVSVDGQGRYHVKGDA